MRDYECRCGITKAFGSMAPPQCSRCLVCGTSLHYVEGLDPAKRNEIDWPYPEAHRFDERQEVETDEGMKTLTVCVYCGKSRRAIEAVERART